VDLLAPVFIVTLLIKFVCVKKITLKYIKKLMQTSILKFLKKYRKIMI